MTDNVIDMDAQQSTEPTMLARVFAEVGKRYGFGDVKAEFTNFKDFKLKWTRSYRWANFQVPDYLNDAPEEVIEGLADTVMSKIAMCEPKPYSKAMRDWVTSDEFVEKKQPIYLKRSVKLTHSSEGAQRDLMDSIERLIEEGYITDFDEKVKLTWTKDDLIAKAGYSSSLMEVIAISSAFDDEDVPNCVVDYVVLSEYRTMMSGKRHFGIDEPIDEPEEKMYSSAGEVEAWLSKRGFYL